jgi:hypothetical protein
MAASMEQQLDEAVKRYNDEAAHAVILTCPMCSSLRVETQKNLWAHLDAVHEVHLPSTPENCRDPAGLLAYAVAKRTASAAAVVDAPLKLELSDPEVAAFYFVGSTDGTPAAAAAAVAQEEGDDEESETLSVDKANDQDDDDDGDEILTPARCLFCPERCERPLAHMIAAHKFDFRAAVSAWATEAVAQYKAQAHAAAAAPTGSGGSSSGAGKHAAFAAEDDDTEAHSSTTASANGGAQSVAFHAAALDKDMFRIRLVNFVRTCVAAHKAPGGGSALGSSEQLEAHLVAHPTDRLPPARFDALPQDDDALVPIEANDGMVSIAVQLAMEDDAEDEEAHDTAAFPMVPTMYQQWKAKAARDAVEDDE